MVGQLTCFRSSGADGHLKSVGGEVTAQRGRDLPSHDHPSEDVCDESDISPPCSRLDVSQIRYPKVVRSIGMKLSFYQVLWPMCEFISDGGTHETAASPHAFDAEITHQALDGAARDDEALALELIIDLASSIDTVVVLIDPGDLDFQALIADLSGRRASGLIGVVSGGSELQNFANRLDSPNRLARVDIADYFFV